MDRPFLKIGFIGVAVVVTSIVLMIVTPSKAPWMMDGFFTPIIAFEFIETPKEVLQLFGPMNSPEQQEMVRAMNLGNRLDFVYMLLYSTFLLAFSVKCARETGVKRYYVGTFTSIFVLASDFLENLQLLGITSKLQTGGFEQHLAYLRVFTWLKWGGIAVTFLLLLPYFVRGNLYSKIVGGFVTVPFILGLLAYFHRSVLNELFALSVAATFVLLIAYCFSHKIPANSPASPQMRRAW